MKHLIAVCLITVTAACDNVSLFGSPTQVKNDPAKATPTPTVTPTPTPTPSPTPEPCSFNGLEAKLKNNEQSIKLGARDVLDLTPTQNGIPVADGCNSISIRRPEWHVKDTSFCKVIGDGYNPQLSALTITTDKCEVWATLRDQFRNVTVESNHFRPEVK